MKTLSLAFDIFPTKNCYLREIERQRERQTETEKERDKKIKKKTKRTERQKML